MRIAIVKPDYGIVGGFEFVMERIRFELTQRGHAVEWRSVDVPMLPRRAFGVDIPDRVWDTEPEYFKYVALVESFSLMRLDMFDLVISTQPPSFAIEHPHHLALFSHHQRQYYDLSDVWVKGGFVSDPVVHETAQRLVRQIDDRILRGPKCILAASEVVEERLRRFNGLDETLGVYHAGVGVRSCEDPTPGQARHVLTVGRHEFPKRTELFVHAMKLLRDISGVSVGGGGRLGYVRSVERRLSRLGEDECVDDQSLWLCRHPAEMSNDGVPDDSNIRFVGHVDDGELARLYADAFCVVAPAFEEDYGLTAIEALQHGKPLIVCRDGGGLVTFVEDGVNGMVVDPTGPAIATAIRRLHDDPVLARHLGEGARATAATYTWKRAMAEIDQGIERVFC